ncbi:molybdopterin dehydrogenase, FAD-binding protein [Desulforamulus reducens MI-1]|uniref:Molybdopterin dehydrogenase, FAD-binding protein n=1 Tax=Desulforamulus reducens (strain ATCC BAA-1160 / DSM 100696 / MI-1) TaxID=349161 RepID=A4J875_DESRM|nr:FAD binding domain-containing protein [Desulforamulus reducens]ABO51278.1 molybdopterin dehydrogenase, FAD-binding protein [Desulforamulus reducens MI-1]
MFTIDHLVQPQTIEEAYQILHEHASNTVLGGSAYLRLGSKKIRTAIDLANLQLDSIKEQDNQFVIGAMVTFRDLETHPALKTYFNGMLPQSVRNIIGVQFRNVVTVGATVYSKYGFSDLLTALLALDTEVELHQGGRMPLANFLAKPYPKDILTRIFIQKNNRQAVYQDLRNSKSDYPILNTAVSCLENQWRIVVGARPLKAAIAVAASQELSGKATLSPADIKNAAQKAAEELSFGTNLRGTAEYRQAMCSVLVNRAITEVEACK